MRRLSRTAMFTEIAGMVTVVGVCGWRFVLVGGGGLCPRV